MLGRTVLAAAVAFSGTIWAQSVISAHSGVIQLTEGTVELDGKAIQSPAKLGQFQDVKNGQTLVTKDGDAEILLTPGVFLRLAENSSFQMVSNKLADTRVEVLSGTAMLQVGELLPDNAITVVFHKTDIALAKRGLYRFDSDPAARVRVYEGEAKMTSGDKKALEAKKGHEVLLDADKLEAKNFDAKDTDAFYRWNERRDEYIAQANITSARSAGTSGGTFTSSAYSGYDNGLGTWMWNPWFGMFTFMPFNGMYYSPFGFGYYSPYTVGYLFMPGSPYYYGGGVPYGYGGVNRGGTPVSSGGLIAGAHRPGIGGARGSGPLGGGVSNMGNPGGAAIPAGRPGMAAGGGMGGGGGRVGGGMSGGGGMAGGGGHAAGGAGGRH